MDKDMVQQVAEKVRYLRICVKMESQKKTVDTLFKKQANCLILKNRTEV
jgi:hypothetical protein